MNQSQHYYLNIKNDFPQKNEYPPNNNTNQNVELYRQKQQLMQINSFEPPIFGQSNINLGQSKYNDYSYMNEKNIYENKLLNNMNNQSYMNSMNSMEFLSSPQSPGEKNKFHNNNINIDNDPNKTLNLSMENNLNNLKSSNNINDNINEKSNKKKNEEVVEDPDEYMFREQKDNDKEDSKKDDESELSADSGKNSDNELEYNDQLLAQYDKVKRVKNKWKVILKGCVVQQDNKEYVCGKVHGELERDW